MTPFEKIMKGMEENEILNALGLKDARIVYDRDLVHLDKVVPAGYPMDLGDDTPEYQEALNRLLASGGRIFVNVRGTSMTGRGIEPGDSLEVSIDSGYEPMDVVVASLNGEETTKVYFVDEDGERWLVPDSTQEQFQPIRMSDYEKVRIIGKVVKIVKGKTPRGNLPDVLKAIKNVKQNSAVNDKLSNKKISMAISAVMDKIIINRHWFCLYNVLKQRGVVNTIGEFYTLLQDIMQEDCPSLDLDDISRIEVESFAKPYMLWDESNAPVHGKRFYTYLDIARSFANALK